MFSELTALGIPTYVIVIAFVWSIVWTGIALWRAARLSHKAWFIAFLVLNTLGLLEIFYIFVVTKNYSVKTETTEESTD